MSEEINSTELTYRGEVRGKAPQRVHTNDSDSMFVGRLSISANKKGVVYVNNQSIDIHHINTSMYSPIILVPGQSIYISAPDKVCRFELTGEYAVVETNSNIAEEDTV